MKGRGRFTELAASRRPLGFGRGLMTPEQFRQGSSKVTQTPTNDSVTKSSTYYPGKIIEPATEKHLPCQGNARGQYEIFSNSVMPLSSENKEQEALSTTEPDEETVVKEEAVGTGDQNRDLQGCTTDGVHSSESDFINADLLVDTPVQQATTRLPTLRNEVDEKAKQADKFRNEVPKVNPDIQGLNSILYQPIVKVGKLNFEGGGQEVEDAEAEWKQFKLEREFNRILSLFNDKEDLQDLVGKFENVIKERPLSKSTLANSELDVALDVLLTKVKNKRLKMQHNIKILRELADRFPDSFKSSFAKILRETQSRLITVAASDTILTKSAETFCSFLGQLYAHVLVEKSRFQVVVSECIARLVEGLTYPDGIYAFIEGHRVNVVETHARALQILLEEVAVHHPQLPSEANQPSEFSVILERTKESVLNASLPSHCLVVIGVKFCSVAQKLADPREASLWKSVRVLYLDGLLSFNPWFATKMTEEERRLSEATAHGNQKETCSTSDSGAPLVSEASASFITVASPFNPASQEMASVSQSDLCSEVRDKTGEPNDLISNLQNNAAGPNSVITSPRRERERTEEKAACRKDQQSTSASQEQGEQLQRREERPSEFCDPDLLEHERSPSPVRGLSLLRAAIVERAGDTEISSDLPVGLCGGRGLMAQKNSSQWLGFGRGIMCNVHHGPQAASGFSRNEQIAVDGRETCEGDESEGNGCSGAWAASRGFRDDYGECGDEPSSRLSSPHAKPLGNVNSIGGSPKGDRKTRVTGKAQFARTSGDDVVLLSPQEEKDSRKVSTSNRRNFRSNGRGFESTNANAFRWGQRERTPEHHGPRTAHGSRRGVGRHGPVPMAGDSSESRSGKGDLGMEEPRSSSPLFGMGQQPSCFKCGSTNHVTSNCSSKESFFF